MKNLRCMVVDDEPLAIDIVVNYLHRLGMEEIQTCANGITAFQQLKQQPVDLLFLDIEMPQLMGFDLLKSLSPGPLVVITTAYRDYAVEGFEWEVLDYLVKPFSFPRFLQTIEKAMRRLQQPASTGLPEATSLSARNEKKDMLFLRADNEWVRIDMDDLLYIESLRDYVRVITRAKTYLVHQTLADITAKLPAERFIRVHRSYTLALDRVDKISDHCAHIGNKIIPISRANRQEVYRRLGQ
jgi:two-component system LytT family response regulator